MKKILFVILLVISAINTKGQTITYDDLFVGSNPVLVEKRYSVGDTVAQSAYSSFREKVTMNVVTISSDDLKMLFLDITMGELMGGSLSSGMIEYSELKKIVTGIEELLNNPVKNGNAFNTTTWFLSNNRTIIKQTVYTRNNNQEITWDIQLRSNSFSIKDISPVLVKFKQALVLMESLK